MAPRSYFLIARLAPDESVANLPFVTLLSFIDRLEDLEDRSFFEAGLSVEISEKSSSC